MSQTNLKPTRRRAVLAALWLLPLLALLSAGRAPTAAAARPADPAAPCAPTLLWQRCPSDPHWCETGWYASPAVADINHDGVADVIWGGYTLMAITGTTGPIGRCPTRSALSTITAPARCPARLPIMTAPRPITAARVRPPISARTAAGTPATDLPMLALTGQV